MSEARAELPEGWKWVRLGDVTKIVAGQSPPGSSYRDKPEGLPFFQGKADFGEVHPEPRKWCVSPTKIAKPGDILLSVRAPVGPTNIANTECCIGRGLAAIRPRSELAETDFIHFALKLVEPELVKQGSGSTFSAVTQKQIHNLGLPLPDLQEQREIVSVLKSNMAEVDKARAATEAQLEAAEKLRDAYLQDTFESEEAQEWSLVQLGSLLKTVQNGIYKSAEFYGQGHTFLRMYNIANNSWHLILDPLAEVTLEAHELKKYQLEKGDLLVSRVNSFELVGKCAHVGDEAVGYVFENMMIRLQVTDESIINPLFLAQQFNSDFVRRQVQGVAKRAIGQSSINSKDINGLEIRLPNLSRQVEIADFLNQVTQQMSDLRQKLRDQYSFINALPTSLLHQAFNGELTRQPSPEDLRAALTCLAVERLRHRPFFGVVMLMKVLYFAQVHHGIPLGYAMRRHKYGPFDKAVYNLEEKGVREGWFSVDKAVDKQSPRYIPGTNLATQVDQAKQTLGRWQGELNELLDLAETFDTTGLEALATLHAAWNDLLIEGRQPKDSEIIAEVLEVWPGKAEKFSKGELRQYLVYLKTSPYVPTGTGQSTRLTHAA